MTPLSENREATTRHRVARLATEVFAPWVWVLGLPLAIGWHATKQPLPALLWGLVVGIFGSIIPMIVIVRGARKGKWDSHHVTNREGRVIPFIACTSSLAVGIAVLVLGNAPDEMLALALAMFATLVACVAITFALPAGGTRGWKISMHAAVAAGASLMLVVTYGPWLLLMTVPTILVCWSRVELGDHTRAQVVWGAAVGLLAGGTTYLLLTSALN